MNLQIEKLNILKTILNTDNESLIMDVKAFISDRDTDWFDDLSKASQQDILVGLAQAKSGETIPHTDVVKVFAKWGLK